MFYAQCFFCELAFGRTFTLRVQEAEAWLYKFKQFYVALSSLIDK